MESNTQLGDFKQAFQQVTDGLSSQQTDISSSPPHLPPDNLPLSGELQLRRLTESLHNKENK